MPKWFLPLTIMAMAVCAVFGFQRLGQSFWDDEVYAMRRAIHGQWRRNDDGSVKFRPVSWQETFWFFDKPQHQLHSIVTRLVLDAWRTVAKPGGLGFREDVARIPSYLAGILSVGAIAFLLWRLGFPGAGVLAAFLCVIHPWHIRYASEMRAYSFMFLLVPLAYLFLIEALHTGRWAWWGGLCWLPFRADVFKRIASLSCGWSWIVRVSCDHQPLANACSAHSVGAIRRCDARRGHGFSPAHVALRSPICRISEDKRRAGIIGWALALVLFRPSLRGRSVEQHRTRGIPLYGALSTGGQLSCRIPSLG